MTLHALTGKAPTPELFREAYLEFVGLNPTVSRADFAGTIEALPGLFRPGLVLSAHAWLAERRADA